MYKKTTISFIGGFITLIFLFFTWNIVFKYFGILTRINYIFYDASLKIFHKKSRSDAIILVDIDEKSLKYEGRWPWSRDKITTVVKILQESGVAVIAFDILFPEPELNIANTLLKHAELDKKTPNIITSYLSKQLPYFDHDKKIAETLANSDVVLGMFFSDELYHSTGELGKPIFRLTQPTKLLVSQASKFIGNVPILANAVRYTGFTTTLPDEDGYIRRSPLLIQYNNALYPSLALEAVRAYLLIEKFSLDLRDLEGNKTFLGVNLGDIYIPTDLTGNILITYAGPAFSFPYISATDVINKRFAPQALEGKIVIIGSSAIGLGDLHSTPLQSVGYPGLEIHASIISSILNKNINSSPLWLIGVERVLMVVIGAIFTALAAYFSILGLFLLTIVMIISTFAFNVILLVKWHLILPHLMLPYLQILSLGIINASYGYLFESRYRKKLHDTYGQYVSSKHIDEMLEEKNLLSMDGNTKTMTVLFADIRNFTSISEKLGANEVKKFLNTLFTPLTEIIFEFKGTIDKYVGDMIMAFWNDPTDDPQHASHAVKTALMMQSKIKELAPIFAKQQLYDIGIRIGINTGTMHVGDMGSKYRKSYTVLGDSVNLASRLEGINKMYKTKILVSQNTKTNCEGIIFRFIDMIYAKGKTVSTAIYEPLCLLNEKTAALEMELKQYEQAHELYKNHNWSESKKAFSELVRQYPNIEIYSIYLNRTSEYESHPPAKDWDGTQEITQK